MNVIAAPRLSIDEVAQCLDGVPSRASGEVTGPLVSALSGILSFVARRLQIGPSRGEALEYGKTRDVWRATSDAVAEMGSVIDSINTYAEDAESVLRQLNKHAVSEADRIEDEFVSDYMCTMKSYFDFWDRPTRL